MIKIHDAKVHGVPAWGIERTNGTIYIQRRGIRTATDDPMGPVEELICDMAAALSDRQKEEVTEPTDAMCDAPRYFIAYCENPGRTFEGARKHLACAGVDFESTWPVWALGRTGHLTKSAVAALIWHMMAAAQE